MKHFPYCKQTVKIQRERENEKSRKTKAENARQMFAKQRHMDKDDEEEARKKKHNSRGICGIGSNDMTATCTNMFCAAAAATDAVLSSISKNIQ